MLERTLVVLLLVALLLLGLLQILLRNLAAGGFFWGDEVLRHLVLWLGFLGASMATRDERHLRIDVLVRVVPTRYHPWLTLYTNLFACLVCVLLLQAAWRFVHDEHMAGIVLSFGVATWVVQSVVPLGFLCMALRFATRAYDSLLRLRQRNGTW
jgi:TRAP-type C4-dicarboxylate transport system permease small subunit